MRNPVVERAGGAALQPDVSEARPMDVSLDQKAITTDTKQGAVTQLTSNNVESGIGDFEERCCTSRCEHTRCCQLRQ